MKKIARRAFVLGGRAAHGLSRVGGRVDPDAVRVLTYHVIGAEPRDPFAVDPSSFATQVRWMADSRRALSLDRFAAFLAGAEAPRGALLVTLDDGDVSLVESAAPVLAAHGVPAVAFVPAGEVGTRPGGQRARRVSWAELRAVNEAGVAIGSHAWTHESLGCLPAAAIRQQGERSRKVLEDRLGVPIRALAYPFGTQRDFNRTTREILREVGYEMLFTSQHGAVRPGSDPLALPRIKVEGGEGMWMFQALARGGLDGWALVDRTMWRLQASA